MFETLLKYEATNNLADRYEIAKTSLQSVIDLTEYEDSKVARLLTVVAFLSAIVGAVFTRFATLYGFPNGGWLASFAYCAFFLYVVGVTAAATILIGSIRPTFNIGWPTIKMRKKPASLFFYHSIIGIHSAEWAEYYLTEPDLKAKAAADYIAETYLVSEKIAKKLWWVGRGVSILLGAMIALVVYLLLTTAVFVTIKSTCSVQPQGCTGSQSGFSSGSGTAPTPRPTPSQKPTRTPSQKRRPMPSPRPPPTQATAAGGVSQIHNSRQP